MEKKETHNEEQKAHIQIKELGFRLRNIREAQGLSIADISNATKIQKHYLAAIEEGNLEHLPKGPYVRSFVRQYCDYLSAQDIWKSYDAVTKKQKVKTAPVPAGDEKNYSDSHEVFKPRSFLWLYLLIALSLGAAAWITWQYRGEITTSATNPIEGGTTGTSKQTGQNEPAAPLSADKRGLSVSGDAASMDVPADLSWMDGQQQQTGTAAKLNVKDQGQADGASKQSTSLKTVRLTAENAYVWTKITQGAKLLFEGTMKPGEYKEFEVGPDLPVRVRIGKPGSASILWEGKKMFPAASGNSPATKFFWPDGKVTDK